MPSIEPGTAPGAISPRQRLLNAMARALAHLGYAEITIADIVAEAGVSRRTFYEHFETKAQCLTALYESASRNALDALRTSIDPTRPWQAQVDEATTAYLSCLAANPALVRTLLVEILGLGAAGLSARRRVNSEIANFMCKVINAAEGSPVLTPDMAMAVVGGINELALALVEQDRAHELPGIASTAGSLLRAAVHAAQEPVI